MKQNQVIRKIVIPIYIYVQTFTILHHSLLSKFYILYIIKSGSLRRNNVISWSLGITGDNFHQHATNSGELSVNQMTKK